MQFHGAVAHVSINCSKLTIARFPSRWKLCGCRLVPDRISLAGKSLGQAKTAEWIDARSRTYNFINIFVDIYYAVALRRECGHGAVPGARII